MRILLNDKEVVIPSSLTEITLGQRIDFYNQYGKELEEMATSIIAMPDDVDKELEIAEFQMEKMFRTFAFFAGSTPEALKESQFIDDIATIYYSSLAVLLDEEQKVELKSTYTWNGEEWHLHAPELKNGSRMSFGEFIDAKQMIKDMSDMGNGRWEAMLRLCAIYIRKKGEKYEESFLYEDSERLKLMRSLPMDIAMAVGFFLTCSVNISINILKSSSPAELRDRVSSVNSIMKSMAG
jgi:hypothetical protein